jgi:hypothetical protein
MRVKLIEAQVNKGARFMEKEVSKDFSLASFLKDPTIGLIGETKFFDLDVKKIVFNSNSFSLEGFIVNDEKQGGRGLLTFEVLQ